MLSSLPLLEIDLSPTELAQRPRGGDQSGYLENPREKSDPLDQHSQPPFLSPNVGQSELRRVASSHDTHIENHIIMDAAEGSSCDRHKSRRCTFPHKTHPKRATSTTKSKSSSAQIAPQNGRPKPSQACHSQAFRAPSAHHPHHGNCKRAPVKLSAPQARTIPTPRPPGPATDARGSSQQTCDPSGMRCYIIPTLPSPPRVVGAGDPLRGKPAP